MQQHPTTKFPLLQSVVSISGISATANTAVMNGGSTLTFDSTPTSNDHHYKISVPALGFSDLALVAGGSYYCNSLCGYAGSTPIELEIADPTTSDLSWMTYGTWDAFNSGRTRGYFVTGFETPISSVPTTGTATYRGSTDGEVIYPVANGVRSTSLIGLAELQANFGTGNIGGNLTSMTADGVPWNSISLLGAISSARNSFSGTAAASSAPGGTWSLLSSASGTLSGRFFGPGAQELGAIWTLFDGNATAVGSIAAKKGP